MNKKIIWVLTLAVMLTGCGSKTDSTAENSAQNSSQSEISISSDITETTLDESTGVLILCGNVTKEEVSKYSANEKVTSIVAADNCVLPEDCSGLFLGSGDDRKAFGQTVTSIDLSKADASKVTNMGGMFNCCSALQSLNMSNLDTSNVKDMTCMFYSCFALSSLNLSNIDTSNVTVMEGMFWQTFGLTEVDLSSFDTSKVTNMKSMFQNDFNLERIYVSDKWTTNSVTQADHMLDQTTALVGGNGTTFDEAHTDQEYARIDTASTPGYFTKK